MEKAKVEKVGRSSHKGMNLPLHESEVRSEKNGEEKETYLHVSESFPRENSYSSAP